MRHDNISHNIVVILLCLFESLVVVLFLSLEQKQEIVSEKKATCGVSMVEV